MRGVYADPFFWQYEKRCRTFKFPGGKKTEFSLLDKHLLHFIADCKEGNLQILPDILIMEALKIEQKQQKK